MSCESIFCDPIQLIRFVVLVIVEINCKKRRGQRVRVDNVAFDFIPNYIVYSFHYQLTI